MKKVIEIIKKHRNRLKLTQTEMGEKLEMTQPNYAKFENGKGEITLSRLEKLAEIFNISVGELLGLGNVEEKSPTHTTGEGGDVQALQKEIQDLNKENMELKDKVSLLQEINLFREKDLKAFKEKLEDAIFEDPRIFNDFILFCANPKSEYDYSLNINMNISLYFYAKHNFLYNLIAKLNLFDNEGKNYFTGLEQKMRNLGKRILLWDLSNKGMKNILKTKEGQEKYLDEKMKSFQYNGTPMHKIREFQGISNWFYAILKETISEFIS